MVAKHVGLDLLRVAHLEQGGVGGDAALVADLAAALVFLKIQSKLALPLVLLTATSECSFRSA